MREHLGFLKTSSAVVKVAAWIFLFFGIVGGISIFSGRVQYDLGFPPGAQRLAGLIVLAVYAFLFFLFFLIAKIADLLIKIINEIKKE